MIIAVAYIAKLATAGKDTSIPPEMITIISNAANIRVTSMERSSETTVDALANAGLTAPIRIHRAAIMYTTIISFAVSPLFILSFILSPPHP